MRIAAHGQLHQPVGLLHRPAVHRDCGRGPGFGVSPRARRWCYRHLRARRDVRHARTRGHTHADRRDDGRELLHHDRAPWVRHMDALGRLVDADGPVWKCRAREFDGAAPAAPLSRSGNGRRQAVRYSFVFRIASTRSETSAQCARMTAP